MFKSALVWRGLAVAITRHEHFDDLRGQQIAVTTAYRETETCWNHWIGSTIVVRPRLR